MEIKNAVSALSALAHEGRLTIFRMLVEAGPGGLTVGEIGHKLDMPGATLSFHLSQLKHAGLVIAHREGVRLIQTAHFQNMNNLVGYLTENCCGGDLSACAPGVVCAPPPKKEFVKTKRRKSA